MKKTFLLTICCLSIVSQAGYNMRMPLEVKNNGRLPNDSIIFKNGSTPTTPEEPVEEPTDCIVDVNAGTYYLIQEAAGESMTVKTINNQRLSNGTKGKLLDGSNEMYGIPVYEICMNGEEPQPYVEPAEIWANGECKYNTLGNAPARYWTEINNGNIEGEKVFRSSNIGTAGSIEFYGSELTFLNFGTSYSYGIQVKSNSQVVYNGYKYYKGKYIYSIPNGFSYSDNFGGPTFTSPIDYYEVCRTQ